MISTKLRRTLKDNIHADTYEINKEGVITLRWGFFYSGGITAQTKVESVQEIFPDAEIITFGTVVKPFMGGAPVKRQTHHYVSFKLKTGEIK